MIAKRIVEQALAEALKTGGDFAELFAQDKRSGVMLFQDGRVEDAVTGRMHGAGVRIYKGLNSVYVHTNDTSLSGLIAAARKAADAVGTGNECRDVQLVGSMLANRHACRQLPMDVSGTRKAELLRRANLAAKDVSPEIQQVRARLMDSDSEVLIANSEGLYTFDRRVYTRIAIAAIAAGSGRRQDYTFAPTSRMRNTYIAPGDDEDDEIISSCGDGLYAKSMGGGSVNPVTGEFNFAVEEGYLIRDGKIDRPVRGATLIGRGADILPRIDRVGRDMKMAQGMCGSLSGSVPTNVGQPMIRVTDITVGGR